MAESVSNESGHSRYVIKRRCECGAGTSISKYRLNVSTGLCRKCIGKTNGLRRKRISRMGAKLAPFEWIYKILLRESKKRNIPSTLTFPQFLTFTLIDACHYCDAAIIWKEDYNSKFQAYNLDRKDNALGYDLDNLVTCCSRCNLSRGNRFTYIQWVEMGKVIKILGD